jgi:hypothetical protein
MQNQNEKQKEGFLCPKCGLKGFLERRRKGEHVYVYMHHRVGKKVRTCYLGAEEYDYVERFNDLSLRGLFDKERFHEYALRIIDSLTPTQLMELKHLIEQRLGVKSHDEV